MNTEDKDIKNEVDEDSTMPIEEDENTNDVVNDKIADEKSEENKEIIKEKKHSNKKTVLIVLGGFIVFCVVAMIITGGWNPFKNRDVTKDAKTAYKESDEQAADIFSDVTNYITKQTGETEESPDLLPTGRYPNGFHVTDYGEDGKDGVLKEMYTILAQDFGAIYGFNDFTIYYMKNEDYANEKYTQLKNSECQKEYTPNTKNSKVAFGYDVPDQTGELSYMVAKKGTVVYEGIFFDLSNYDKVQNLFDKLGIDMTLPPVETAAGKINK